MGVGFALVTRNEKKGKRKKGKGKKEKA